MSGRSGDCTEPRGLYGPKAEKTISLALQGGGAHGAFTWGVLDALIEDGRLAFEAITGASAGSLNAVAMTDGWLEAGPDGARARLETFWRRVSLDGGLSEIQRRLFDFVLHAWAPRSGNPFWDYWSKLSPDEANPLDINPLRDVLQAIVDFGRLRAAQVKLFISATHVRTGKIAIFNTGELTSDHVMASACLPTIFRAVTIAGEPYWDGGYMGNPALFPLFYETAADDILLVQVNPLERIETPTDMTEIQNRLTEITFNAGLLRELRSVDFVGRLIAEGKLDPAEYKQVRMHRVDGGEKIARYLASSRLRAEWDFFRELRDLGRASAQTWLASHFDDICHRATLDLRSAYS